VIKQAKELKKSYIEAKKKQEDITTKAKEIEGIKK
jgi:hypothetical protein